MNQAKTFYEYTAAVGQEKKLSSFLIHEYGYSSRLLRRIKAEGAMRINGKDCWLCTQLRAGDRVEIELPPEAVDADPVARDIDVIYEDEELLVVNKDAGCVTHPTKRHQDDTLSNYVANYYIKSGQNAKIRFINRLDTDTTGIVVIAKNKYVHHYIQSRNNAPDREKIYLAFVHGTFEQRRGVVTAPIGRRAEDSIIRQVTDEGKPCVTHYEVLEQYADAAMLRLRLETGRTHQIRVHMRHIGHPIIGDALYGDGSRLQYGMTRQALHSTEMALTVPSKGRMRLRADFKEDMLRLWQTLRAENKEEDHYGK